MAETRGEQVAFGWTGEGPADTLERPTEARSSTPRRPRQRSAQGERSSNPVDARRAGAQLPPDNELWDVHAVARFLKRSVSWVYHRAEDGTLPVKRIGGWGLRFIPAELRAWVDASGEPRRKTARGREE
jgi:predicted DNA-binding transcriptional regulator AlpA